MSGSPEMPPVTSGGAVTTHETDSPKPPSAKTDKPLPASVTPGILSNANPGEGALDWKEIIKLDQDISTLDVNLMHLGFVSGRDTKPWSDARAMVYRASESPIP